MHSLTTARTVNLQVSLLSHYSQVSDLASSEMLENFENGEVIFLNEYGLSTSCKVLPSLYEGHVIGKKCFTLYGLHHDTSTYLLNFLAQQSSDKI